MSVEEILKTHPRPPIAELAVLVRCIDECGNCEATCTICADACDHTLRTISRQTDPDPTTQRTAVEACLAACRACGDECERHAQHHEHCRLCAEQCRRCERACQDLLATLNAA